MSSRTTQPPAEQLRRGVPAEQIRCEQPGCTGTWDGRAGLSADALCPAHRAASTRLLDETLARFVPYLVGDAADAAQPA